MDRFDVEVTATTATSAAAAGTTAEQRLPSKKTSVEKVVEFEDEDRPPLVRALYAAQKYAREIKEMRFRKRLHLFKSIKIV